VTSRILIEPLLERIQRTGAFLPENVFVALLLRGKDAQDLLHRLSTNDLRNIPESGAVRTVLTTEKGRILDRVEIRPGKDSLLVVCHAGAREKARQWIARFIIAEDVEILSATDVAVITWVHVPESHPSDISRSLHALLGHFAAHAFGTWESPMSGLTCERALIASDRLTEFLMRAKVLGPEYLSANEYRALRVAAGIPSFPGEINDDHNPLEAGLRTDVSFTKGCYVGQEVIARLESYDKVLRDLVVLRVAGELVPAAEPIEIIADGVPAGVVTSIGGGFRDGTTLVMGYIRRGPKDRERDLAVRTGGLQAAAQVFSREDLAGWLREGS
jgi:tRNA-modifying protein YgfZ